MTARVLTERHVVRERSEPLPAHFESFGEEEEQDAEIAELEVGLGVGENVETVRPERRAGEEIAQNWCGASSPAQRRHRDGRREKNGEVPADALQHSARLEAVLHGAKRFANVEFVG